MKYLIPVLMIALGAFVAWFMLFRKKPKTTKTETITRTVLYDYGMPVMPYDVPGPATLIDSPLINPSQIKIGV